MLDVAIIGGGAAGFFAAINLAERRPSLKIEIFEASSKFLSKVLVSGGGRCNLTNEITDPSQLAEHYPRGHAVLAPIFTQFGSQETQNWFRERGLDLKTEPDGRVFPQSNSSQSVYDLFLNSCKQLEIGLNTGARLKQMEQLDKAWLLHFKDVQIKAKHVVICTGGNSQIWTLLSELGLKCIDPSPSLFTFKSQDKSFAELSGVSLPSVRIGLGDNSQYQGPLLITHQGFSGPVVLKLSAWKAAEMKSLNYEFDLHINWMPDKNSDELYTLIKREAELNPKIQVANFKFHSLPKRLYKLLCHRAGLTEYINGAELGKKKINALAEELHNTIVHIKGKSTFKEEFVTAGGLSLDQIDLKDFSAKSLPNLYFAGEVLNIDAVTGGFNFQAAWSAAYLISQAI